MLPTLFISHGAPNLAIVDSPARRFLAGYGAGLPKPRAVVVASAHFCTEHPVVVSDAHPGMIYDFNGFDPVLKKMVYPAPGDPALAENVARRLDAAGFQVGIAPRRGYDHGTWVPLSLVFPEADVPVVQLSIQPHLDPAHHFRVGAALRGLAEDDVLVVGSGALTHNLREVFDPRRGMRPLDDENEGWAERFAAWMSDRIAAADVDALLDYRRRAPEAVRSHPEDDHLLPIFVALGAAAEGTGGERIHSSGQFGTLMMDAYAWG